MPVRPVYNRANTQGVIHNGGVGGVISIGGTAIPTQKSGVVESRRHQGLPGGQSHITVPSSTPLRSCASSDTSTHSTNSMMSLIGQRSQPSQSPSRSKYVFTQPSESPQLQRNSEGLGHMQRQLQLQHFQQQQQIQGKICNSLDESPLPNLPPVGSDSGLTSTSSEQHNDDTQLMSNNFVFSEHEKRGPHLQYRAQPAQVKDNYNKRQQRVTHQTAPKHVTTTASSQKKDFIIIDGDNFFQNDPFRGKRLAHGDAKYQKELHLQRMRQQQIDEMHRSTSVIQKQKSDADSHSNTEINAHVIASSARVMQKPARFAEKLISSVKGGEQRTLDEPQKDENDALESRDGKQSKLKRALLPVRPTRSSELKKNMQHQYQLRFGGGRSSSTIVAGGGINSNPNSRWGQHIGHFTTIMNTIDETTQRVDAVLKHQVKDPSQTHLQPQHKPSQLPSGPLSVGNLMQQYELEHRNDNDAIPNEHAHDGSHKDTDDCDQKLSLLRTKPDPTSNQFRPRYGYVKYQHQQYRHHNSGQRSESVPLSHHIDRNDSNRVIRAQSTRNSYPQQQNEIKDEQSPQPHATCQNSDNLNSVERFKREVVRAGNTFSADPDRTENSAQRHLPAVEKSRFGIPPANVLSSHYGRTQLRTLLPMSGNNYDRNSAMNRSRRLLNGSGREPVTMLAKQPLYEERSESDIEQQHQRNTADDPLQANIHGEIVAFKRLKENLDFNRQKLIVLQKESDRYAMEKLRTDRLLDDTMKQYQGLLKTAMRHVLDGNSSWRISKTASGEQYDTSLITAVTPLIVCIQAFVRGKLVVTRESKDQIENMQEIMVEGDTPHVSSPYPGGSAVPAETPLKTFVEPAEAIGNSNDNSTPHQAELCTGLPAKASEHNENEHGFCAEIPSRAVVPVPLRFEALAILHAADMSFENIGFLLNVLQKEHSGLQNHPQAEARQPVNENCTERNVTDSIEMTPDCSAVLNATSSAERAVVVSPSASSSAVASDDCPPGEASKIESESGVTPSIEEEQQALEQERAEAVRILQRLARRLSARKMARQDAKKYRIRRLRISQEEEEAAEYDEQCRAAELIQRSLRPKLFKSVLVPVTHQHIDKSERKNVPKFTQLIQQLMRARLAQRAVEQRCYIDGNECKAFSAARDEKNPAQGPDSITGAASPFHYLSVLAEMNETCAALRVIYAASCLMTPLEPRQADESLRNDDSTENEFSQGSSDEAYKDLDETENENKGTNDESMHEEEEEIQEGEEEELDETSGEEVHDQEQSEQHENYEEDEEYSTSHVAEEENDFEAAAEEEED